MNATHTPRIEVLNDHGEARIYDGPDDEASAIALVYAGLPPPWSPQLISQAAAMLDALQRALPYIEDACDMACKMGTPDEENHASPLLFAIRSTLAHATLGVS